MPRFQITFTTWENPNECKYVVIGGIDQEHALYRFFKTHNINTTYIVDIIDKPMFDLK